MTSTWRPVTRLAVGSSKERVGIWSRIAWSVRGCAGFPQAHRRCWTCEQPTLTESGAPSGDSMWSAKINASTAKYEAPDEVDPVVTLHQVHLHHPRFRGRQRVLSSRRLCLPVSWSVRLPRRG